MGWWVSVVGGCVILLVLWDVFHSLWHPVGQGVVTRSVMTAAWRLSRSTSHRLRQLSGPFAMAAAIASWFGLVLLGGALVYWPYLPEDFGYGPGVEPAGSRFVDAFYLSVVTTTTLGFGDVVPTAAWLRVLLPFQALIGFVLLTAAVSWVLQVYPALARRRTLALRLALLGQVDAPRRLGDLTPATASRLLDELTAALAHVRVDLTQYAESYYFEESSHEASLAMTLRHAVALADAAVASPAADVRFAGETLGRQLDDLALVLDEQFLRTGEGRVGVLAAYAKTRSDDGGRRR